MDLISRTLMQAHYYHGPCKKAAIFPISLNSREHQKIACLNPWEKKRRSATRDRTQPA